MGKVTTDAKKKQDPTEAGKEGIVLVQRTG
jgi:hypothetical protein